MVILAITKIIKVKINENACIRYVTNPHKTNEGLLVTYSGCQAETIAHNFQAALSMNKRKTETSDLVRAYHFIQSFAKTDQITPETANEIGIEMIKRLFGDKYAYVCATHIDKGHIHNHIVLCAAERSMTGKKLNDNLDLLHRLQKTNDDLCREHGLDVIVKKRGKGKKRKEWDADLTEPKGSKKRQLRDLIDEQIGQAESFDDFLERMKAAGASLSFGNSKKYGKVTKYKLPDAGPDDKWHRGYSLGAGYSDEMIRKRIDRRILFESKQQERRQERAEALKAKRAAMTKGERALDRTALKIKKIVDTSDMEVSADSYEKRKWYERQNAMRAEQIKAELLKKYGTDYTKLRTKIHELEADSRRQTSEISAVRQSAEMLRTLVGHCSIYSRSLRTNLNYHKSKNPERYYEEHEDELNAFAEAEDFLKRAGVDLQILSDRKKAGAYIEILQRRLASAEETVSILEEQVEENNKIARKLRDYQKELDIYYHDGREL